MSAPTEPSATAKEPRLPGLSSSWTRSMNEGTRNTVSQGSAVGMPVRRPLAGGADRLGRGLTRLGSRADLPRRGSPPRPPGSTRPDRRRTGRLRRPTRRHPRAPRSDAGRRRDRRGGHRQPVDVGQRHPARRRRAGTVTGAGAVPGAEVGRGPLRGPADSGGGRMSTNDDVTRRDGATLGARIAAKDLSSVEVTRACLDRIAETDDKYRAFLHVAEEQALAAAADVD